jgi:hypothetical protein
MHFAHPLWTPQTLQTILYQVGQQLPNDLLHLFPFPYEFQLVSSLQAYVEKFGSKPGHGAENVDL